MIANGICEVNTYKFGLIIMMNLIMLFLYLVWNDNDQYIQWIIIINHIAFGI